MSESSPKATTGSGYLEVPIDLVDPNPANTGDRVVGDEEDQLLVESVRIHGVLEPVVVRRCEGRFELVAGERRLWAAKQAGRPTIPIVIQDGLPAARVLDALLTENNARRALSAYQQILCLLDAVRRHRAEAAEVGQERPSIDEIGRRIGISGRQAQRLWTVSGRIDEETHKLIAASAPLRRSLSLADLDRVGNTHVEERAEVLRKLEEALTVSERPAQARKRGLPAIRRGRLVIRDGRRQVAECSVVSDERLPSDRADRPVVGLQIRVPAIVDLADVEVRKAVVAELRRTLNLLVEEIESGQAFDGADESGTKVMQDPVVLVSTGTYQGLPAAPEVDEDAGGDSPAGPVVGEDGGMIEVVSPPAPPTAAGAGETS